MNENQWAFPSLELQYKTPEFNFGNTPQDTSLLDSFRNWMGSATDKTNMFGNGESTGWFSPTVQGLGTAANAWLGMQQLDLAKQQLAFQKDAFAKNWSNQVQLTNQQLYDRDVARRAAYGQNPMDKTEFINTSGVK
ncbi:hypothetical protein HYP07_gp035 [Vibrio phage JSF3]|uniref:Uncharacterized protein n=2 Tax=Pacinivirus VCO139 TaxID=2846607 RepID=R9R4H1_9CAUD|nr:hypothetical protein M612_gp48 [Vibrio phage JA-1]YP_009874357.1 hypothetical protein HYO77_gp48 [Vibrio phage VCO139]YP_009876260.1 hypothetical protein HYP07_gp035 [Vibrio phage JSF3]AGI61807.1 hypothetical protein JA1_0055 [Vibrio phage JA-1]AGI61883.1 hypothetical protein VCO139_0056 [Vibrio phage VCO139]APD18047.1 hypothetical protein [Vibrio phage JSF3]